MYLVCCHFRLVGTSPAVSTMTGRGGSLARRRLSPRWQRRRLVGVPGDVSGGRLVGTSPAVFTMTGRAARWRLSPRWQRRRLVGVPDDGRARRLVGVPDDDRAGGSLFRWLVAVCLHDVSGGRFVGGCLHDGSGGGSLARWRSWRCQGGRLVGTSSAVSTMAGRGGSLAMSGRRAVRTLL